MKRIVVAIAVAGVGLAACRSAPKAAAPAASTSTSASSTATAASTAPSPSPTASPVVRHAQRCADYTTNMGKVQAATEALGKSTAAPDALGDQVAAMAVSVRKYQSEAADDSVVASHYGTLADGLESMARMFHQPAAVNSANPDAIKNVMGQVVGAEIWRCP